MKLLLDEMYPPALADALRGAELDVLTISEVGMNGRSDSDVLAAAGATNRVVLTENVADFARICAERISAGEHHPGVLIALSSRFSRRLAGIPHLAAAVRTAAGQQLQDRVVYLAAPTTD